MPTVHRRVFLAPSSVMLLSLGALLGACRAELPDRERSGVLASGSQLSITVEPEAELEDLPLALRLRIRPPSGVQLDPFDVHLVSGSLGAPSLRQLERREPSAALEKRLVRLERFLDGDDVVVATTAWLEAQERYTLALPSLGEAIRLHTTAEATPQLERAFPEGGQSAATIAYCGPEPLPHFTRETQLDPQALPARWVRGSPAGYAQRCVFLELGTQADEPALPPPVLTVDDVDWSLDPRPLEPLRWSAPAEAVDCDPDETAVVGACLWVADDRARLRTPGEARFWALSGDAFDVHRVSRSGASLMWKGLVPSARQQLRVESLDERGVWQQARLVVETGPPRAHFVLSEVYADAIGPEPQQEWIEVHNDGLAPGSLEGYVLIDVGGETPLPEAWLAPGEYALLVNESFDPSGEWDAPPASGTQLVRVPRLGKSGLSNQGEPLRLDAPDGAVVSRFPATPKPKPGLSVARRFPDAPDDAPSSFARATRGPTPGWSNEGSFDD